MPRDLPKITLEDTAILQKMSNTLRFLCADMVQEANSGHPGAPMGLADIATGKQVFIFTFRLRILNGLIVIDLFLAEGMQVRCFMLCCIYGDLM